MNVSITESPKAVGAGHARRSGTVRILLINQFFWPDSAATSQFLTDLARELAAQNHEVHVVCAASAYAEPDGSDMPSVRIHSIATLPFARGLVSRALSYVSFLGAATWKAATMARPELIITLTTPPLLPMAGTIVKLLRGSRHCIWEMDVYPDVALDLDYLSRGRSIVRLAGVMADFSRLRADCVIALGDCMRQRLLARGVPDDRIRIAENWADGTLIRPSPFREDGKLTVLYSGNLGLAHDIETISRAMLALKQDPGLAFIFAGGGPKREALERWCKESQISNAAFRPYSSRARLGESLGEGDIGLVTLRTACVGSVVPSKVYGLMAAGRPILFVGPPEATPARIIQRFQCGWRIDCGDDRALVQLLRALAARRSAVRDAGRRARLAFESHYDLPAGVRRICEIVGAVTPPEYIRL
jgi:colanic acid biosynthesis glycosyl transferase WcaI